MIEYNKLCAALAREDVPFEQNVPLAQCTTFQIGGPAAVFCVPRNFHQLAAVIRLCHAKGIRWYLLGKGSNILFADGGFDGVVIHLSDLLGEIIVDAASGTVTAQAGAPLSKVCICAQQAGLAGLEFAYGIPGSVGGAVYMNAGAYGGEMKDVLQSATYFDEMGTKHMLDVQSLALGYRTSIFEQKPWCVYDATFQLRKDNAEEIRVRMLDYAQRRATKQPLELPSAGSTFKRPSGAFAGALIDGCGLRGFSVGGAAISTKHCGFVVNTGGATCADVLTLTDRVCEIVQRETGYILEKEVRIVK